LIPLAWWAFWFQLGSESELAKFHIILPHMPVRLSLVAEGLALGFIHGLISAFVACLLFNFLPNWIYLRLHKMLYAFCWLVPFCGMALFGWAMSGAMPGANPPPTPMRRTVSAWEGSLGVGIFGGAIGIAAFALTQIPWFQRKPLRASLLLFVASCLISNVLKSLLGIICFEYHLRGLAINLTSMGLGLLSAVLSILATALFLRGIASWLKSRKQAPL
jgi:hypothetical protein